MKFSEWVREKHPESVGEGVVGDAGRRLPVGVKRAGEGLERALGGDPHACQRSNRLYSGLKKHPDVGR